jgi:hypothetical protein
MLNRSIRSISDLLHLYFQNSQGRQVTPQKTKFLLDLLVKSTYCHTGYSLLVGCSNLFLVQGWNPLNTVPYN